MPSRSPSAWSTRAAAMMSPDASRPARLPVFCTARRQRCDENAVLARSRNSSASRLATLYGSARFHIAALVRLVGLAARVARMERAQDRGEEARELGRRSAAARMYSGRAISSARPTRKRTSATARPSVSSGPTNDRRRRLRHQRDLAERRVGLEIHRGLAIAEQLGAVGVGARQLALLQPARRDRSGPTPKLSSPGARALLSWAVPSHSAAKTPARASAS